MKLPGNRAFFVQKYRSMFLASSFAYLGAFIVATIDSMVGGRALGESAVASVTIVNPLYTTIMFLGEMLCQGASTLYSQEAGKSNLKKAHEIFGTNLVLTAAVGAAMALLLVIIKQPYLKMFGCSPEIYENASRYYNFFIVDALAFPTYWLLYNMVFADGDESLSSLSDVSNVLFHLAAAVLTVRPLGTVGLGLSTAGGDILAMMILLSHFGKKSNSIRFRFKIHKKELLRGLSIGFSSAVSYLLVSVLEIVMSRFVVKNFTDAFLPAFAVCNFMTNLLSVFASINYAASPMICVYYGEGNSDGLRRLTRHSAKVGVIFGALVGAAMFMLAPLVPRFYGIVTPEVLEASIRVVRLSAITIVVTAMNYAMIYYYPVIECEWISISASSLLMLLCPAALEMLFGRLWGFTGIALGLSLTPVVTLALTWLVVWIVKRRCAFPGLVPESRYQSRNYNLPELEPQRIMQLQSTVDEALLEIRADEHIRQEIALLIEEVYMLIREKNPGKKIASECSLLFNSEEIKLIMKDNGKIFDITDSDASIKSMRCYVVARMMEQTEDASNQITTSFNRNSFCFRRKEAV